MKWCYAVALTLIAYLKSATVIELFTTLPLYININPLSLEGKQACVNWYKVFNLCYATENRSKCDLCTLWWRYIVMTFLLTMNLTDLLFHKVWKYIVHEILSCKFQVADKHMKKSHSIIQQFIRNKKLCAFMSVINYPWRKDN